MQTTPAVKKPLLYKIGMFLIISSFIIWVTPLGIPFLPLSSKTKVISITSFLVLAEVTFWLGAIMVGKEVAGKIRKYFNPKNWRKKEKHENENEA
ncbi:transporter suffix domain-containing protein [Mesobacillus subterraneus]|uniref:transporter suffix domain-containing protein n=1 Tax=Mesobacillus subterraneus TaxID=285983 RepID=UPI001CFC7D6B|nr:transporter suffix domain-containing protein [Mesobacillus subterraneus]WLR54508.1 transporter suffix domain-containing protein [Mesobacillus subterraneus]